MTERGKNEFNIDQLVRLKEINKICKDVKTMFRDWDDFVSESISLMITWWKDPKSALDTNYVWFPHYTAKMKAEMKEQMKKGDNYKQFLEAMKAHNKENGNSLEPREVIFEDREGSHYRIDGYRMGMIQDIVDEVDMYSSIEDFFDQSLDLMITWWSNPSAAVQIFLDMWPYMLDSQRKLWKKEYPETYYDFEKRALAYQEQKSIANKNSETRERETDLEIVQQPLQQQKISETNSVLELHSTIGQDQKILSSDGMEKIAIEADEAVGSLCTQLNETDTIINDLSLERKIKELPDAKMDEDGNIHGKLPYDEYPIIWAFYSRFFPVKVVISVLADMIAEKGVGMVEYDQLRERAWYVAVGLSQEIKQYEKKWKRKRNVKTSAGLPQPPVDERAYPSKIRRDKINKFWSSKERFQNHFIGMNEEMWNKKQNAKPDKKKKREEKPTKNKNGIAYFSGALNAMGLASFEVEKEKGSSQYKIKIGLTPKGAQFYRKRNPVLVNYMDKRGQVDNLALDAAESTFIRKNIIPKFSLEEMFVSKIEEKLNEKTLNAKEIDKEFGIVCTDWLQKEEKKDVKNAWFSMMNMVRSDDSVVTPWRVATMGRLSEMGIVNWVIVRETNLSEFSLSKPVEKAPKITTH